jgi:hypothetical protein
MAKEPKKLDLFHDTLKDIYFFIFRRRGVGVGLAHLELMRLTAMRTCYRENR